MSDMNARLATEAERLVPALVDENRKMREALEQIKRIYLTDGNPKTQREEMYYIAARVLHQAATIRIV
jgi:hypothetical protein